MMISVTLTML